MFQNIMNFLKRFGKREQIEPSSKDTAKERLHLVLMQDRANVSADFLDMMRQEIIEVIKKYIDVDENDIDVRLTNRTNEDGTTGAPALYANIPITGIKEEVKRDFPQKQEKKKEEDKPQENTVKNEEKAENENQEIGGQDSKNLSMDNKNVQEQDVKPQEERNQEQNEQKSTNNVNVNNKNSGNSNKTNGKSQANKNVQTNKNAKNKKSTQSQKNAQNKPKESTVTK